LIQFLLNDKEVATEREAGTVLLDLIRYQQHLMGTKIGCREGDCGACTVLVGELKNNRMRYQSMTSCLLALGNIHGKHIVTIEGVNFPETNHLNPIQRAMAESGATQCGFCTPGFIVSLAGFCLGTQEFSYEHAITSIDGNICRCTGYKSIERSAKKLALILSQLHRNPDEDCTSFVTRHQLLPSYFISVKDRLKALIKDELVKNEVSETNPALGGGTDLYVQKPEELAHSNIRFLFHDPELKAITRTGNTCIIGPSATVSDLLHSPVILEVFPQFRRYAKLVSSTPIRNMATIAGNFINASPIGDFTIFFLAINAQLTFSDGHDRREIPLRQLYKGYKTLDKKSNEYLEKIWFEIPSDGFLFHFEKVSKRTHLDIASVNTALQLVMKNDAVAAAGMAAGGVAPVPLFLKKTSEWLTGKKITAELVEESIQMAQKEISPISDARGSADYKRLLLGQLIKAHFITLFPEMEMQLLANRY
jgi:xanthine dehydrogenase small subunit